MYKQLAVALLALTLTVPVIAAQDADVIACEDVEGEETLLTQGDNYVTDDPALFEESNAFDGLQSSAFECDEDGNPETTDDIISVDADSRVL